MAYAAVPDVQDYLSTFTITVASTPSTAQVTQMIANCANEIDSALLSGGYAVPITSPAVFLAELVQLNALGTAAWVAWQAFPATTGPDGSPLAAAMSKQYQARLQQLRLGVGVPVGLPRQELQKSPMGFLDSSGAWGNNFAAEDDFGHLIRSEPAFSRNRDL